MSIRLSAYCSLVLLAAWACAEPDPTRVESGLARDQRLFSLSDLEKVHLCDATNEASIAAHSPELQAEALCTARVVVLIPAFAAGGPVDRAQCERERDACIERGEADTALIRVCNSSWTSWFGTCSATIAEYEHCMTAMLRASADAFAKQWECAAAAEGKLGRREALVVPECDSFQAQCGSLGMPES